MSDKIFLKASRVKQRKKIMKIARLIALILALLLLISYIVIRIIYGSGTFTIRLDRKLYYDRGLIIYDDPNYMVFRSELHAEPVDFLDNISYKWLPTDLHEHEGGSHNGDNYIAYTFYLTNTGEYPVNYWSEITIDYVMKEVDEAVRVRVYKNGEYKTYAKIGKNGRPEPETVPFVSDRIITTEFVERFQPEETNKYTIVIWLEGTDPECTDNILGGEIKLSMSFNAEILDEN
ncbi:MAG TPA: hypothetical protein GX690_03660 [Tenericutes bacterium]|nr:hypothetical protein [Mycoplasmatota bacterium]